MSEGKKLNEVPTIANASYLLCVDADGGTRRLSPGIGNGLNARKKASPGSAASVRKDWTRVAKITSKADPAICEVSMMSSWGAVGPRYLKLLVCAGIATWNREAAFWEDGVVRCLANSKPKEFTKIRFVHENPQTNDCTLYLEVNNASSYSDPSKLHVVVDRILGNAEAIAQPCEGSVPDGAWVKEINLADITVAIGGGKCLNNNLLRMVERRWCA